MAIKLGVYIRDSAETTITAEDYKILARSKAVQYLDLTLIKTTDEDIKTVVGIPQLVGIGLGGNDVTDAGIQEVLQKAKKDHPKITFIDEGD